MSGRRLFRVVVAVGLAALLGGCANLPFFSKKSSDAQADAAAASPPDRAVYQLEVNAPSELRSASIV